MKENRAVDILLVEDSEEDAGFTIAALKARNLGDKVVRLVDGDSVLEFICAHSWSATWKTDHAPKLILLDLKLTRLDGLEVLQQLKVRDRTRPIPVVVFTGSHDDNLMTESYRLGANSYVIKPNDPKEYSKVVGDIAHYWLTVNRSFH